MKRDWFRNEQWSGEIEQDFFAHLKRSRDPYNKAQYLRIQAVHLCDTKKKENILIAKGLLEKCLADYPEDQQRSQAFKYLAKCHAFLGNSEEAVKEFRRAVQREFDYPQMKYNSNTEFARFVTEQENKGLYEEILHNLDQIKLGELAFPSQRYDAFFSYAVICENRGDIERAQKFAKEAITEYEKASSGFARHKLFGLVRKDESIRRMERILKK